jgi:hypothetical protein
MKFRNNLPAVEEVKNTDIVGYLATLGFKPGKGSNLINFGIRFISAV